MDLSASEAGMCLRVDESEALANCSERGRSNAKVEGGQKDIS